MTSVETALALVRAERRRRLGGALDAVAVSRSNAARSAAAITARTDPCGATPAAAGASPTERRGWGPRRRPAGEGVLLRADHEDRAVVPRPGAREAGAPPDPDDPDHRWLR